MSDDRSIEDKAQLAFQSPSHLAVTKLGRPRIKTSGSKKGQRRNPTRIQTQRDANVFHEMNRSTAAVVVPAKQRSKEAEEAREDSSCTVVQPSGLFCSTGLMEPEISSGMRENSSSLTTQDSSMLFSCLKPNSVHNELNVSESKEFAPSLAKTASESSNESDQFFQRDGNASVQSTAQSSVQSSVSSSSSGTWPAKDITRKYSTIGRSLVGEESALKKVHILDRLNKNAREQSLLDSMECGSRSHSVISCSSDEEDDDSKEEVVEENEQAGHEQNIELVAVERQKTTNNTNRSLLSQLKRYSSRPVNLVKSLSSDKKRKNNKKMDEKATRTTVQSQEIEFTPDSDKKKKALSVKKLARLLSINKKQ